mmetsp:Transcript_2595/g.6183  ORF Transcript_2595/g.6183 Transcript_2595/m.6183 type:complete len:202 (+) Transcript_2595:74-679(+)
MPSPQAAQIASSGSPTLPITGNPNQTCWDFWHGHDFNSTRWLLCTSKQDPSVCGMHHKPKNCSKSRRAAPNTPASQVNSLGYWVSPTSQVKSNQVCWDLRRCVQLSHIPVLASSRTSSERRPRLTPAGRVLEKVRELQLWRNGSPAVEPRVQLDPLGLVGLDISNGRQSVIEVPGSPFHLAVRRLRKVGDPVRRSLHELRG